MTVTLELTPELQNQLEQQAKASGKEVSDYIADTLENLVLAQPNGTASLKREEIEEWLARFDRWASRRKSYNPHFDDNRESIYPDRT